MPITTQQKANKILQLLKDRYPVAKDSLQFSEKPHEILFATMLSAHSTDKKVNSVTPTLFERYKDIQEFAQAELADMIHIIQPVGLYNTKAKRLVETANILVKKYNAKVPKDFEDLQTLPGVGKKTASVVMWHAFKTPVFFTVDTHVTRLARWFGLTKHKDPDKISQDLMQLFPKEEWGDTSLRLIYLGREVLTAKSPKHKGTIWEELVEI